MRIVTSVRGMQRLARRWRRGGPRVALVPTMGYLHAGHLSLVKLARRKAGRNGRVVVSIYVNPAQFGPGEDFARYPRDLARDKKHCRAAGVDVLFVPPDREMYPDSQNEAFSTFVVEHRLSRGLEGASRPAHFKGVTTVVAKLFNIILPDLAVFGAKDFQQAAVIQQMVRDLNIPVKITVAPIVREADGLALSSRNAYLSPAERRQAVVLRQAIQLAQKKVAASRRFLPASRLRGELIRFIQRQPAARVDYVEFFDPKNLEPVRQVARGVQMALAVFLGKTRLIDNARL
ncbi:MAG: pantoate--beta-alanine ligase [Verrucomicrobia bacterium]|nr:pantoate--beta-alanine ligase [Verrucomicrobiota bacterium]